MESATHSPGLYHKIKELIRWHNPFTTELIPAFVPTFKREITPLEATVIESYGVDTSFFLWIRLENNPQSKYYPRWLTYPYPVLALASRRPEVAEIYDILQQGKQARFNGNLIVKQTLIPSLIDLVDERAKYSSILEGNLRLDGKGYDVQFVSDCIDFLPLLNRIRRR